MSGFDLVRDYLYALRNAGSKYGIDRMRALVAELGHPERRFPVIHVAGTNGKGSTCAMLEAVYRANGYKTGFFSSPHLVHLGERAQVNRQVLSHAGIVNYVEQLRPIAERLAATDADLHPSFFEFVAAMAFLRFATEQVDVGIIETGLGGRLDATNVVDPELSIITTVSLDHTELLGDTLGAIATEKAGIVKPGKPVLMGCLPAEAAAVVEAVARERGCALYRVQDRFPDVGALPRTNLAGSFQRWNAATAVYATELLAERFPLRSMGALEAVQAVDWPGRWQRIELGGKTLILDATHNPEGCVQLAENLAALPQKPRVIVGTLGEERGRHLLETVLPFARDLHLVQGDQPRAARVEFLRQCVPNSFSGDVVEAELKALFPRAGECGLGESGDVIVLTGSLYLIGEVLERLATDVPTELGSLQERGGE